VKTGINLHYSMQAQCVFWTCMPSIRY